MKLISRVLLFATLFLGIAIRPVSADIYRASILTVFSATEVIGDNEAAAYIGTGGLLLPMSFSGTGITRTQVADCKGCTWAYSVFCMYDSEGLCQHSVAGCPVGQVKYRVWFGRTKSTIEVIGSVCWGIGKPPTRTDIENRLDDLVVNYVPELKLSVVPPNGTLTSVPVFGWVNQPAQFFPPKFQLAGRDVLITATASWRWNWGDGSVEWKASPGKAYPNSTIWHSYRSPGQYQIGVLTTWQAKYQVEGIGTFPVGGEVLTQLASTDLDVLETKTVLLKR